MKRSFTQALAEFGVIVVGVLTALGLEGGRQLWQDAQTERDYLVALREEVATNLDVISSYRDRTEGIAANLENALAQFEGGHSAEAKSEMLFSFFASARHSGAATGVSTAVFDDLRSTGNLRLLRDLQLRRNIAIAYAGLEDNAARIEIYAERIDSRLLYILTGYGIPLRLTSSDALDPTLLDRVAEDPGFVPELNRERARLVGIIRPLDQVIRVFERLISDLDAAIAG